MGIFRLQAAFSLFAGPRRSIGYAYGRQIAAALPETEIDPFKAASDLDKKEESLLRAAIAADLISTKNPYIQNRIPSSSTLSIQGSDISR